MLDKLLEEYKEQFGESFPMFIFADDDEKDIIKAVKKCIADDEPYKYEDGMIY